MQGAPGTCEPAADALKDGVVAITEADGTYTVSGLVPAQNTSVQVSLPSGGQQTVPVVNGAIWGEFSSDPTGVTFSDANSRVVTAS
jgi:hypothetical protein